MSEPVNPLFEEEKEFLERKKLEYERALRGDVAQIKEQGAQVGKVALVGAGALAGIWLLSKAISGRRRRKARQEWEGNDDDNYDLNDSGYHSQYFADLDEEDEHWNAEADPYFGGPDEAAADHGTVYHTDTDRYDDPTGPLGPTSFADDADDNGLGDYPGFPAHSEAGHGSDYGDELPYDDSRRLPDGDEFEAERPASTSRGLGATLLAFAKSDMGKAVLGQAISIAAALAAKAFADKLGGSTVDTTNTPDLAAASGENDGYAHGHPAQPQPAASDASSASADFSSASRREPLA